MSASLRELTLPLLCRIAMRLDAKHREETLRDSPSLTSWVKGRVGLGIAWAVLVDGEPVCAIGVYAVGRGDTGYVWLAGARGWTKHLRKIAPLWRGILTSGAYARYVCDTFVDNAIEKRWVEHLGFKQLGQRGDRIYHAMTS